MPKYTFSFVLFGNFNRRKGGCFSAKRTPRFVGKEHTHELPFDGNGFARHLLLHLQAVFFINKATKQVSAFRLLAKREIESPFRKNETPKGFTLSAFQ